MRKVNNVDLAGLNDFFDTAQMNLVAAAIAAEREACAAFLKAASIWPG